MIINFERGKQIFGNDEDFFQNELLNFANISSPQQLEACVAAHVQHNSDSAATHLQALLGSAKFDNKYHSLREVSLDNQGVLSKHRKR